MSASSSHDHFCLDPLERVEKHLSLRYIISAQEYKKGRASLICDALSYGVGQITSSHGVRIVPCKEMVQAPENLSYIIREGPVGGNMRYIDIAVSDTIINFETMGFSSLLSLIAGDIFGSPYFQDLLLLYDLKLPDTSNSIFAGPCFGSDGVISRLDRSRRKNVFLGLLLKPDVGVSEEYYIDIVEAAIQGGIDYIKEDELTIDSEICPRFRRIEGVSKCIEKSKRNTLYAANVTSPPHIAKDVCMKAIECGATALLINGIQVGLDTVLYLAKSKQINVPIHFHRAGYDILSSGQKAIHVSLLTRLFRLAGADIVHVGSPLGGLFSQDTVKRNTTELKDSEYGIKSSLPVFSRSSSESLEFLLNSDEYSPPFIVLFDSEIYTSPKGIERSIKDIRKRMEQT